MAADTSTSDDFKPTIPYTAERRRFAPISHRRAFRTYSMTQVLLHEKGIENMIDPSV